MDEVRVVYDKAKYHLEGTFPADLSTDQAYVHTGMFLGWLVDHGLTCRSIEEEFASEFAAFRQRKITGPELYRIVGGVLDDSMLSDDGKAFTSDYFDLEQGKYLEDYLDVLGSALPSLYHVADTWKNYETLRIRIDQRYFVWKARRRPSAPQRS